MARVYLDHTKGGQVSLTKAFLSALQVGRDAFELYFDYFRTYTLLDPDYNLSALSRFAGPEQRRIAAELYKIEDPSKDPDWLSFWSAHDVNRVSVLFDRETVVYVTATHGSSDLPVVATGQWIQRSMQTIEVFHDFRSSGFAGEGDRRKVVYLLLAIAGRNRKLFVLDEDISRWIDARFGVVGAPFEKARTAVDVEGTGGGCDDFLDAICVLVSSELCHTEGPRIRVARANHFLGLSEDDMYAYVNSRIRGGLRKPVVVVAYDRNYGKTPLRMQIARKASKCRGHFSTLAVLSPSPSCRPFSERVRDAADCHVVCVYAERVVCLLADGWATYVAERHFSTQGLKEKLHNRHLTRLEGLSKRVTPGELQEAIAAVEAGRRGDKRRPQQNHRRRCRCPTCHASKAYDSNMSRAGPERLCSTQYTISELLRILNIDFPGDALEKIVELSVAAMDIESRTEPVSLGTPRPGPTVEYAEVDRAVLEGHVRKVQTPIMIAHTDALTEDSTWSLTSGGDDPTDTYRLLSDYWTLLLERRADCVRRKKELAQPIFDVLTNYRAAFAAYYLGYVESCRARVSEAHVESLLELESSHSGTDDELSLLKEGLSQRTAELLSRLPEARGCWKTWRSTLPGQLEAKLHRLVATYTVFSFCG